MFDATPLRSRLGIHLAIALVLALLWALALQKGLGASGQAPLASGEPGAVQPGGRRLYILMVDALNAAEVADMPHLTAMAAEGVHAALEPCLDLFTTACVREALTGRPSFDLLAPFEDFGVAKPKVGPNLLRDAAAAGLHTEMFSTGHLGAFRQDVAADPRIHEPFSWSEVATALEIARRSDIVLHHWVWHDIASHHMLRKPSDHLGRLKDTDEVVARLLAGLPEDMDLMVMGDHGHFSDGRHLQGMDLPTAVVVRSPNLRPTQVPGRAPIAAVRFLGSAVTGLLSPAVPADPSWSSWLAPEVATRWKGGAPLLSTQDAGPGLPLLAVTLAVCGLVVFSAGGGGGAAALWGAVLGAAFGAWLDLVDQQASGTGPDRFFWVAPVFGALAGLVGRRNLISTWEGGLGGGGLLLLGLYPGLKAWGVLRNIALIAVPCLVGAGVHLLLQAQGRGRKRLAWALGIAAATALALYGINELDALNSNFFQVRGYPGTRWARSSPVQADALAAALAGLSHLLLTGPSLWAILSAAGAALGRQLPPEAHLVSVGLLAISLLFVRGPWRGRLMSIGAGTASAYLYPGVQRIGVLAIAACVGLGLRLIAASGAERRAARWAAALLAVGGAYLGVAWTCGLNTSGINYSFAVQWTVGSWHTRLWWLMGAATALQIFVPAILITEHIRASFLDRAEAIATAAGRLALARFAVVLCLASAWLFVEGGSAATLRLSILLQDALAWLLLACVGVGTFALGRERGRENRSIRPAPGPDR